MTTPKIPKGWRKLRKGTFIREHDKYWCNSFWDDTRDFREQNAKVGGRDRRSLIYIRKSKPKK